MNRGLECHGLLVHNLAAAAVFWLLFADGVHPYTDPISGLVMGATTITLLMVIRQVVAVRQNVRLLEETAARQGEARFRSLVQNSSDGAGFIGIAVALMGRNHPIGVVLAAVLFGFLYQGGAELGLWTSIPIELRTVVQGLVILFTGALDMMVRMLLVRIFALFRSSKLEAA